MITIRCDRRTGDDALIVDLHRRGYAPHGDRFGPSFYDFVAETVAEAALDNPARGRVWFAERGGMAIGCAAFVDRGAKGQLRWVVADPEARGTGLGRTLVQTVLDHAQALGKRSIYLETTDDLAASKGLYDALGFETVSVAIEPLWHGDGVMIVMQRRFGDSR